MCEDYSLLKPLKIPELKWKRYDRHVIEWIPPMPYFYAIDTATELLYAIIAGIDIPISERESIWRNKYELGNDLGIIQCQCKIGLLTTSTFKRKLLILVGSGQYRWTGRGSGVGFILLYVLGITQINPLRETTKCFAWRFLEPRACIRTWRWLRHWGRPPCRCIECIP